MAMAQTAFKTRPAFYHHNMAASSQSQRAEMPLFQALFTIFFCKSHGWALYQRHYYDRPGVRFRLPAAQGF